MYSFIRISKPTVWIQQTASRVTVLNVTMRTWLAGVHTTRKVTSILQRWSGGHLLWLQMHYGDGHGWARYAADSWWSSVIEQYNRYSSAVSTLLRPKRAMLSYNRTNLRSDPQTRKLRSGLQLNCYRFGVICIIKSANNLSISVRRLVQSPTMHLYM